MPALVAQRFVIIVHLPAQKMIIQISCQIVYSLLWNVQQSAMQLPN